MALALPTLGSDFVYIAPVVIGLICAVLELLFVHEDEPGMGWITHGLHAVPFCILFTFLSMNVSFIYNLLNLSFTSNLYIDLGIRVAIGLIAAIKIKAAAAVTKGHGSVGEKLIHALIIGLIIAASPYLWALVAGLSFIPEFIKR